MFKTMLFLYIKACFPILYQKLKASLYMYMCNALLFVLIAITKQPFSSQFQLLFPTIISNKLEYHDTVLCHAAICKTTFWPYPTSLLPIQIFTKYKMYMAT